MPAAAFRTDKRTRNSALCFLSCSTWRRKPSASSKGARGPSIVRMISPRKIFDGTSVLELEENEFQKLFRQIFGGRNLAYLDGPFLIPARQKDEGFEGIQAF